MIKILLSMGLRLTGRRQTGDTRAALLFLWFTVDAASRRNAAAPPVKRLFAYWAASIQTASPWAIPEQMAQTPFFFPVRRSS